MTMLASPPEETTATTQADLVAINRRYANESLTTFLEWSLTAFGDQVAQVTSFAPAGNVILDHLAQLAPGLRVLTVDTQFLFPETYDLWAEIERRYPITLEVRTPQYSPQEQTEYYGPQLWNLEPDVCCHVRKVTPLGQALHGLDAWITGIRRDQAPSRAQTPLIGWDHKYELFKISPLAAWSQADVWQYIHANQLPYNELHDQGYQSIGCTHCTRPVTDGDERAGRWQGRLKTECGLHVNSGRPFGSCPE